MAQVLVVAFDSPDKLLTAAREQTASHRVLDAFTPFPVEGLAETIAPRPSLVRTAMFGGGVVVAGLAYVMEWYSAVIGYPIDSGGRPLHSWPAFMMVPFALGILAAAVAGLIALFVETGLPRLNHPLFAVDGFEAASQDKFLLAVVTDDAEAAMAALKEAGASLVREVPS
jgi:hypothetical protein